MRLPLILVCKENSTRGVVGIGGWERGACWGKTAIGYLAAGLWLQLRGVLIFFFV